MLMKSVGHGRNAAGHRSEGGSGRFDGLQLLAEAAVAVSVCEELHGGSCGHSDPASCFFASKKRKLSFPQTQHSLLLQNPTNKLPPIKLVIKHKLPAAAAAKVSAFPPALDVAPISFVLPPPPPPPAAPIPPPLSSVPSYSPPPKVKFAALVPDSRREEFPSSFRARVSSAVGDGSVALGTKFSLVIRKTLTDSDLRTQQCRLSIPGKSMANELLTNQEEAELEKNRTRIKLGVFLDPDFEIIPDFYLSKWKIYALTGGWKLVLRKIEQGRLYLTIGDEIEVWSFRNSTGELCLALVMADSRRRAAAAEKEAVGNADGEIESSSGRGSRGMTENESPMKGNSSGGSSSSAVTHEGNHAQLIGCSSSSSTCPALDLTLRL